MKSINIKKKKDGKLKNTFGLRKKLLELEKDALKKCSRIDFLNNILDQVPKIVDINCTKFDRNTKFLYKKETNTMENLSEISHW